MLASGLEVVDTAAPPRPDAPEVDEVHTSRPDTPLPITDARAPDQGGDLPRAVGDGAPAPVTELEVDDFSFVGPLGSDGARLTKITRNHFALSLGAAPKQPTWSNKVQFRILRHARGNSLVLDVTFASAAPQYFFNEYFASYSYDGQRWNPVHWDVGNKAGPDTLRFPTFTEDAVVVGHQVPLSYDDMVALIDGWKASPFVKVTVAGQSLGGRDIHRIAITDPASAVAPGARWVHYFAAQHPGEHNAQWRMVGMIRWLLSPEAADFCRRSIVHFVLATSPDSASHGWYRVNADGVDVNRTYRPEGTDARVQIREAYVVQKDFEALMASEAPVTTVWSMHTWPGAVEPQIWPGPEIGTTVGPWTELATIMDGLDTAHQIKPLALEATRTDLSLWAAGPHRQFGVTTVLCEGGGGLETQEENLASGVTIIKAVAAYYKNTRR